MSFGIRLPLRRLHGAQAATTFSQVVRPPLERGMTWSKVRSCREPQYWHSNLSRRKTLKRVNAGWRAGCTYSRSDTTEGRCISKLGLRTTVSYSETMLTRSRHTALIASCHDHNDKG